MYYEIFQFEILRIFVIFKQIFQAPSCKYFVRLLLSIDLKLYNMIKVYEVSRISTML